MDKIPMGNGTYGPEQQERFAEILQKRREQISPKDVGLPTKRKLSQEDVAALAGVTHTVITKIEQRRYPHRLRYETLDNLCTGLHYSAEDRNLAFALMGYASDVPVVNEEMTEELRTLWTNLEHIPAYIMGEKTWNLVAYNRSAVVVFGPLDELPEGKQNILWFMFACPETEKRIVDWKSHAGRVIAQFRPNYDKMDTGERKQLGLDELVKELKLRSHPFHELWEKHEIKSKPGGKKTLQIGEAEITLMQVPLAVGGTDLLLITYPPVEEDTDKLRKLLGGQGTPPVETI